VVTPLAERLRTTGVWTFTEGMTAGTAGEFAARLEALGYSALWLPDTLGRDPFAHIAHLARATTTLLFATGIASISHRHPGPMRQAANTVAEQSGGRFVLGLGVSHEPFVSGVRKLDYSRPLSRMRAYLDAMADAPYTAVLPPDPPPTVLAALGPKMLDLARDRTDGAHPYFVPPEHTALARERLGVGKVLAPEQAVILTDDADSARELAREHVAFYMTAPNYRNNMLRLGFDESDLDDGGSERLRDAVVVWGDEAAIQARVQAHLDAGADHVCIQPLPSGVLDLDALRRLAPALLGL